MSGIIYKITCNETGECYVGSTTQGLKKRMSAHRCLSTNANKNCSSKCIIERNNYTSEIIEFVNFGDDKSILKAKEKDWISKFSNIVNKIRPILTRDEKNADQKKYYRGENHESIKEKGREQARKYYHENKEECNRKNIAWKKTDIGKEKVAQYQKNYREGEYREQNLERKKEYYQANKEMIREKSILFRKENAEKIKENKRLAYLANKETIREKQRLYREENREKINERTRLRRQQAKDNNI